MIAATAQMEVRAVAIETTARVFSFVKSNLLSLSAMVAPSVDLPTLI